MSHAAICSCQGPPLTCTLVHAFRSLQASAVWTNVPLSCAGMQVCSSDQTEQHNHVCEVEAPSGDVGVLHLITLPVFNEVSITSGQTGV